MKKKLIASRRDFLKTSGSLFGAACLAPSVIPSNVLGATAPSNRINVDDREFNCSDLIRG